MQELEKALKAFGCELHPDEKEQDLDRLVAFIAGFKERSPERRLLVITGFAADKVANRVEALLTDDRGPDLDEIAILESIHPLPDGGELKIVSGDAPVGQADNREVWEKLLADLSARRAGFYAVLYSGSWVDLPEDLEKIAIRIELHQIEEDLVGV